MQSRMFLSDEHLLKGKCTRCKKYLSVPPIIIEANKPLCGRCIKDCEIKEENRAYFYENLAKYIFFPCVNDIHGCTVQSPWGQVLAHEDECQFTRYVCPAIDCQEEVTIDTLVNHFEACHNHLLLKESGCHLTNEATDSTIFLNQLMTWNGKPLIIKTKNDRQGLFLRISSLDGKLANSGLSLKLTINLPESSNLVYLKEFQINKFRCKSPLFLDTDKIEMNSLSSILGSKFTCTFTLKDISEPHNCNIINEKLLLELECSVCKEYMSPPILMCSTGHSICAKCRGKLLNCPSCKCNFNNSRNFALEQISQTIFYPCINRDQGCDFSGKLEDIVQHNATCSFYSLVHKKVDCFIARIFQIHCEWKGCYTELHHHFNLQHPTYCADLRHPMVIDVKNNTVKILSYDNNFFTLIVCMSRSNDFNPLNVTSHWDVMYIADLKRVDKYMYNLEFVNNNKIFSINEECGLSSGAISYPTTKCVTIPFNLLNPFIVNNQLTVKMNLTKLS